MQLFLKVFPAILDMENANRIQKTKNSQHIVLESINCFEWFMLVFYDITILIFYYITLLLSYYYYIFHYISFLLY